MKTLLFPALVAALAVLPVQKSEAVKFGEFPVGYKFKLKVDTVLSTKKTGIAGTAVKAPIPTGIPKYAKGEIVAFEIVSKGALKTNKFSIPFKSDGGSANVYNRIITGFPGKTDNASIFKNSTNKAYAGSLTFIRISGSYLNLTTSTVTYTLKRPL